MVLPLPKKLLSTEVSVAPSHSQSISSRSSDSRIKLLTMPTPGLALVVTDTFPNMMYLALLMVGASVDLMMNSAPSDPYCIVVPCARVQSLLAPAVKSVVRVVPKPASAGQAERMLDTSWRGFRRMHTLLGGIAVSKGLTRDKIGGRKDHSRS